MRLVTWNLGQRRNGKRRPDRLVAALASIEPDIVVLVDRTPGTATQQLCAALARIGLGRQVTPDPGASDRRVVVASRMQLEPGSRGEGTAGHASSDALHVHVPAGTLDLVCLRPRGSDPAAARSNTA